MSRFLSSNEKIEDGTVFEFSPDMISFVEQVTERISSLGGACLIVDYGEEKEIFPPSLRVGVIPSFFF